MDPKAFLDAHKDERMKQLFEFLRFPSVSAKSDHTKDVLACADWLCNHLNSVGIESKVMPTGGHPVVFGSRIVSPDKLTVLYYGHYDVQPQEPLELWKSGPFEPVIKDGYIMART